MLPKLAHKVKGLKIKVKEIYIDRFLLYKRTEIVLFLCLDFVRSAAAPLCELPLVATVL